MTALLSVFLAWYAVGLVWSVARAVREARRTGGHPAPAALVGVARALPPDLVVLALACGAAAAWAALT